VSEQADAGADARPPDGFARAATALKALLADLSVPWR
jgi:hypothetical protein